MIRAAAVKYLVKTPNGNYEIVLCGSRHGDCFDQEKILHDMTGFDFEDVDQGFIDNDNNFLTRTEAFDHAMSCGQLPVYCSHNALKASGGDKILISEELW